jgi:hypothetical protein
MYGLGPSAIDYPVAATEMAKAMGFTPAGRPATSAALLGNLVRERRDVVAVNLTLMEAGRTSSRPICSRASCPCVRA